MKRVAVLFLAMLAYALACLVIVMVGPARAHDWYPRECCHEMDCAPVDTIERDGTDYVVASKHGKARVPQSMQRRESKDSRVHVCIRDNKVVCIFFPGAM